MMEAGKLRHTVSLQSPATVQDTNGDNTIVWTEEMRVKAAIEPLSTRERFMAAQEHASATHRIRIRYRAGLQAMDGAWRVVWGARIFPLAGLPEDVMTRHRETHLLCEEGLKDV